MKANYYKYMLWGGALMLFITMSIFGHMRMKERHERFFNKNIKSILISITPGKGYVSFRIKAVNEEFYFMPNLDSINKTVFDELAKPGDSIIKKSGSPILELIHGGKIYKYSFETP